MSDKKKDLFQRIADAVNNTNVPVSPRIISFIQVKPSDTVIGEVPVHLRQVCLLIDEIMDEIKHSQNERDFFDLRRAISLINTVFFISLKTHIPELSNHFSFKVCTDWKIVGVSEEEAKILVADAIGLDLSEFVNELDDGRAVTDPKLH